MKKNYRTVPGDTFVVTLPDAAPSELVAQDLPLDVVYEDADLIVVNKPRGMVVHPAPGHEDGTLVNALLAHCGESLSRSPAASAAGLAAPHPTRTRSGLHRAAQEERLCAPGALGAAGRPHDGAHI